MKITVILPVYNRANLVSRAIESVLNQSFHTFELIVVDDGSTDNIDEVMKTFSDARIIYCKLEQNGGVSKARNHGLVVGSGEAICFLDSDDALQPHYLQKMQDVMQETGAVVVACSARHTDCKSYPTETQLATYDYAEDKYAYLLGGNIFPLPCLLFNSKIKNKLYFDPSYTAYEDYAMLLDILSSSSEITLLNEELVNVHDSDDGINKNYDNILRTLDLLHKKHEKKLRNDRLTHYNFLKNVFGLARLSSNKKKIFSVMIKMASFSFFYFDLYEKLFQKNCAFRVKNSRIKGR